MCHHYGPGTASVAYVVVTIGISAVINKDFFFTIFKAWPIKLYPFSG